MSRPMRQGLAAALLACALATGVSAKGLTVKDQRLGACYDDMVRLCPGVPDKRKLKSCIRPRQALVSPQCRAWLGAPG